MPRINFLNILYDVKLFFREHFIKVIIALALCVIAMIIALVNGFAVKDIVNYAGISNYNVILVINGARGFWAYYGVKFATLFFLTLVMFLLSFKILSAIVNYLLVFIIAYFNIYSLCIIIRFVKVSILPAAIIGLIPFLIIYLFVFCVMTAYVHHRSCEFQYYGEGNYLKCVSSNVLVFLFTILLFSVLILLECILVFLLTTGVVI